MIYQHQRPSSRWLIVTARETARHKRVAVDHTTYLALNSVCAAPNAKTTVITTVIYYLTKAQLHDDIWMI